MNHDSTAPYLAPVIRGGAGRPPQRDDRKQSANRPGRSRAKQSSAGRSGGSTSATRRNGVAAHDQLSHRRGLASSLNEWKLCKMDPRPINFFTAASGGEQASGLPETLVTRICTDSGQAQAGDLFIAIRGEQFDGNEY